MLRSDVVAGVVGLALAVAVCGGSVAMPMGTRANPGAGFTPFWIGVALALLSLGLIAAALAGAARPGADGGRGVIVPPIDDLTREPAADRAGVRRLAVAVAAILVYAYCLGPLGYLPATFLLLTVLVRVLDERRWSLAMAFALVAAVGSWAFFKVWLGVGLPDGVLGGLGLFGLG